MKSLGYILFSMVLMLFMLTHNVSAIEYVEHLLGVTEKITYSGGDCVLDGNVLDCRLKPGDRFMIVAEASGDDELIKDACMLFSYSGVKVDRTSGLHSEPHGEDSGLLCTGSVCDPDKKQSCFITLAGKDKKSVRIEGKVEVLGSLQIKSDLYVKTSHSTQRKELFINIHSVECYGNTECEGNKSCIQGRCVESGALWQTTSTTSTTPSKTEHGGQTSKIDDLINYVKNLPDVVKLLVFVGVMFIILFFMHTNM